MPAVQAAPSLAVRAPDFTAPAIELVDISYNYGERRALDAVSFAIAEREMFALLGPNGGGKTTLFKLLSTLAPLQSGDARILGIDLCHGTLELRRQLGVVFQHPSVDGKLTVGEKSGPPRTVVRNQRRAAARAYRYHARSARTGGSR